MKFQKYNDQPPKSSSILHQFLKFIAPKSDVKKKQERLTKLMDKIDLIIAQLPKEKESPLRKQRTHRNIKKVVDHTTKTATWRKQHTEAKKVRMAKVEAAIMDTILEEEEEAAAAAVAAAPAGAVEAKTADKPPLEPAATSDLAEPPFMSIIAKQIQEFEPLHHGTSTIGKKIEAIEIYRDWIASNISMSKDKLNNGHINKLRQWDKQLFRMATVLQSSLPPKNVEYNPIEPKEGPKSPIEAAIIEIRDTHKKDYIERFSNKPKTIGNLRAEYEFMTSLPDFARPKNFQGQL